MGKPASTSGGEILDFDIIVPARIPKQKDRKHRCTFCEEDKSKIRKHLRTKHNVPEENLDSYMYKGDFQLNCGVKERKRGELRVIRHPISVENGKDYVPCNECYGFMRSKDFCKHAKNCSTIGRRIT